MKRRQLLIAGTGLLVGCDRIVQTPQVRETLGHTEDITRTVQRLVTAPGALAPEYTAADISPTFKGNGTIDPDDEDYQDLAAGQFKDWRLDIGGLVAHPAKLSLDDLRAMPSRTQITRHDCVEGWSCIGKWKGVPLGSLLQQVGLRQGAAYIVFHCVDRLEQSLSAPKY
jgi:DMSO/TMAO reductase YedYZ molybdopterin-dependent catalytic subunit